MDVFEIRDFSVATSWESIAASIEGAARIWLSDGGRGEKIVSLKTDAGAAFTLVLHGDPDSGAPLREDEAPLPRFMTEMLDQSSDFSSVAFSERDVDRVQRWFGLSNFALLSPDSVEVVDADEMASLQGALSVALASCMRHGHGVREELRERVLRTVPCVAIELRRSTRAAQRVLSVLSRIW